ncbi:spore coat protein U domain-containing protein [Lysobacter sp. 2RAF19]
MTARIVMVVLLGALAWCAPTIARAQACLVVDTSIAFGAFDPTAGAAKTGQGTVRVGCLLQRVPVTIRLGTGQSLSYASRVMKSPAGGSMTYNLYTTATLGTIWGDGITGGTGTVQCTTGDDSANGCDGQTGFIFYVTYPVYGKIDAAQPNASVGSYTDDVVVTMIY